VINRGILFVTRALRQCPRRAPVAPGDGVGSRKIGEFMPGDWWRV